MAREFVMGARLQLRDIFTNPIATATRYTQRFRQAAQQADRATVGWRQRLSNLRDGIFSVQGAVTALATGMAVQTGYRWLVQSNADMETYRNTLTVVMKDQKKAVQTLEWAEKFAAATPFEIPQIVEATTRMSAYGLNAQKTLGIVGDMASVMGKDLMQAVEAVADAQTGEVERLKEFGITKKMIEAEAKLMKIRVTNSKGQITDQKGFNAALFSIMEKRYRGGMAMQSKTFKGMVSNASDFIGQVGRKLGKPIFDKLLAGGNKLMAWISKVQANGQLDAWINKVINGFSKVGGWLAMVGGWIVKTASWFKANWGWIGPFVYGLAIAWGTYYAVTKTISLATKAWTAAQWLLNAAMTANPIGLIILGIGLLIGAGILLYKNWDKVKAGAVALWAGLKNMFVSGVNFLIDRLNNLIRGLNNIPGVNIGFVSRIQGTYGEQKRGSDRAADIDGSHANGLNRVPFDGYRAELHKGERVLTADEARAVKGGFGVKPQMVTKQTIIQKLIEKVELHDVGTRDIEGLVDELIAALYDRFSGADDILANAEWGAVL